MSSLPSVASKVVYNLCTYLLSRANPWYHYPLDLSQFVALKGDHYVAIGEHADLWVGQMTDKWFCHKKVAVKVLRGGSSSNPDFLAKFKDRLECEARIWQNLKHPNVSEFYGLAFNFGYMPALILPFYSKGTVVEYVSQKTDAIKLDMVTQISQGLVYLHEQSVIHGDIRGSNVLIDDGGNPRLCDGGLAFIIEPSEFTSIKTAGACRWTAPEIMNPPEDIMSSNDSFALFTKKSDIYAFAMIVIEVFTGKIPFSQKKNDSSVIFFVLGGGRPDLSVFLQEQESLRRLVQDCWQQEPGSRPTSRAVYERLKSGAPEAVTGLGAGNTSNGWFGRWI